MLVAIGWMSACGRGTDVDDLSPTKIVIATGASDGVFQTVGTALAAAYNDRLPSVRASTRLSVDSQSSADAIERGEADVAFEGARTTYLAYKRGTSNYPTPHTRLRALAVLFPTVVHIAARRDSGIGSVTDLRGRRVFVGAEAGPGEQASRVVLESHGLTYRDIHPVFDRNTPIVDELRSGTLDGLFLFVPVEHALATEVMRSGGAHLIPIEEKMMEPIRSRSPLLKPASIATGTYSGQSGTVVTVGTDVLLVCRADLSSDLVYDLTKTLFEAVGELGRAHRPAAAINPNRGPAATIPLHPGAARYYRERELFR